MNYENSKAYHSAGAINPASLGTKLAAQGMDCSQRQSPFVATAQRLAANNAVMDNLLNQLGEAVDRLLGAEPACETAGNQIRGVPNGMIDTLDASLDTLQERMTRLASYARRMSEAV